MSKSERLIARCFDKAKLWRINRLAHSLCDKAKLGVLDKRLWQWRSIRNITASQIAYIDHMDRLYID